MRKFFEFFALLKWHGVGPSNDVTLGFLKSLVGSVFLLICCFRAEGVSQELHWVFFKRVMVSATSYMVDFILKFGFCDFCLLIFVKFC